VLFVAQSQRPTQSPPRKTKAKSASDRLYQNAGVQAKRKELLKARAEAKEEEELRSGM
jgi:hypothetical protein